MAITQLERTQIQKVFIAMLDAAPSVTYLDQLVGYAGRVYVLARDLAETSAFNALYPASLTDQEFANRFVANFVGSTASAAAQAYVADEVVKSLAAGVSRADTLFNVVVALQAVPDGDATFGDTKKAFENKVAVANHYAIEMGGNSTDLAVLTGLIAGVTPTTDVSTPEAIEAVIGATPAGTTGQVFTLTPGADLADTAGSYRNGSNQPYDFKFTAANETVNGTSLTFDTVADSLVDGSTTDNDVFNLSFTTSNGGASVVANIETLNVTAANAAAESLDLSNFSGLKTLKITGTPAGNLGVVAGVGGTAVGNTGVTTIDASGVTTNVAFTVDSSTSTATANLTIKGVAIGTNTLNGGLGNDVITGGSGVDFIDGGAGNDTINAGNGANFVDGGTGNDTITTGSGNDTVTDTGGNNTISVGNGTNTVTAGSGNDTITGGTGVDTITTGGGNDVVTAGGGADLITLTNTATAANSETIKFEATAAANGADTINGFVMGAAATGGDVLNFSAFLGKAVQDYIEIDSTLANNVVTSNVVVVTNGTLAAAAGNGLVLTKSANIVAVEFFETGGGAADDAVVRYITTDVNGTVVSNNEVATLVGVAADATNSIAAFAASNFA